MSGGVEVASGGVGTGVGSSTEGVVTAELPGEVGEFRFIFVRLWFDQRPCIERFNTLEPWLLLRK